MADSDGFKFPSCKTEFTIAELEMYEVYEEESKQTEFDCTRCQAEIIITSNVTGWSFDTELRSELDF